MATGDAAAAGDGPDAVQSAAAQATGRLIADNSWKSWARRPDGPEGFQWSDLMPGLGAQWSYARRRRLKDVRGKGKPCPVCFEDDPEPDEATGGRRWQRLYCGCTVCSQCVQHWNSVQLEDAAPSSGGAGVGALPRLTCPACKATLRAADAVKVLEGCPEVAAKCEEFCRDTTLRTMPEWRSCPKCKGGGFTTPECLAERRRELSKKAANNADVSLMLLMLVIVVTVLALPSREHMDPHDVWCPVWIVLVSAGAGAAAIWILIQAQLGVAAILATPMSVECPNCDGEFVLPEYVQALANANAEEETQKWIASHTRPCPSCGSPIQKTSGCNHMRCLNCRADFCWACMRLGRECGAFGCHNGAPFGNASLLDGPNERPEPMRQRGNRSSSTSRDPAHVLSTIRTTVRVTLIVLCLMATGAALHWVDMHGAAASAAQGADSEGLVQQAGDVLSKIAETVFEVLGSFLTLIILAAFSIAAVAVVAMVAPRHCFASLLVFLLLFPVLISLA